MSRRPPSRSLPPPANAEPPPAVTNRPAGWPPPEQPLRTSRTGRQRQHDFSRGCSSFSSAALLPAAPSPPGRTNAPRRASAREKQRGKERTSVATADAGRLWVRLLVAGTAAAVRRLLVAASELVGRAVKRRLLAVGRHQGKGRREGLVDRRGGGGRASGLAENESAGEDKKDEFFS